MHIKTSIIGETTMLKLALISILRKFNLKKKIKFQLFNIV